ncbi:MAG: 5'/3'-nucleotidase SurE [Dehalococcoidales bacterium]|jgi:5'-nucleotidase|nr:5'/3'-nucleotidase SurE [Dehalococcoidales bacterium]
MQAMFLRRYCINGKLVGMKILVTNDDGIFADTLWILADTLNTKHSVSVAAPDREQSATGTMVTLRLPLRVRQHNCFTQGIDVYSIEGSPSDSVILAIGKLVQDVDVVVSGINLGLNLGDDVLISGTVGAAMQGYLRGLPAIAISVSPESKRETWHNAARLALMVADAIKAGSLGVNGFFNINFPDIPVSSIKGIRVTRLAHKTHIDTVEQGYDGRREYYWLVRQQLSQDVSSETDIWAVENGYISITPLHAELFHRSNGELSDSLCAGIFNKFKQP